MANMYLLYRCSVIRRLNNWNAFKRNHVQLFDFSGINVFGYLQQNGPLCWQCSIIADMRMNTWSRAWMGCSSEELPVSGLPPLEGINRCYQPFFITLQFESVTDIHLPMDRELSERCPRWSYRRAKDQLPRSPRALTIPRRNSSR